VTRDPAPIIIIREIDDGQHEGDSASIALTGITPSVDNRVVVPPTPTAMRTPPMARFAVILPAAGRSTRFGDPKEKKTYAELDGRAVWLRAADPFLNRDDVGQVIVAIAPEDRELFERRYRPNVAFLNITVVEGGAERHDTIARALEAVDPSCDHVAVHDAARPCVTPELVDRVFAAAIEHGAAILGVPVADTLKRVDPDGTIIETVPRAGLYGAQTPQVFRRDLLVRAYADRAKLGDNPTDDARLVEAIGHPVRVVEGSPMNLKITTAADLRLASAILRSLPASKPDAPAHPFADERAMWGDLPRKTPGDLFS
jgi:2-C-methyl-D-erythritol 4-phosphate cytidylyltransferase